MTAPLNDVALAAWTTLTVCAGLKAASAASDRRRPWLLLAGAMLGAALSIKYLALVFVAAACVPLAWQLWQHPRSRRALVGGMAVTLLVATSVAGIWYARAAYYRGNPVYPFFGQVFGTQEPQAVPADKTPLTWRPQHIVLAPWLITTQPENFGGRGHQLGPLFLILLPGLLVARRRPGLGMLLAGAAA